MGAQDPPDMDEVGMKATIDSRPVHRVYVDGFFMDKSDVTNAEFAKFVRATGYVTVAERKPRAEDFPGAPPENLVAGSVVFSPPDHGVPLNDYFQWWNYVAGANWRHPLGPKSSITGKDNYPVVQVAYEDAVAYAKWAGKRLPTLEDDEVYGTLFARSMMATIPAFGATKCARSTKKRPAFAGRSVVALESAASCCRIPCHERRGCRPPWRRLRSCTSLLSSCRTTHHPGSGRPSSSS